MQGTLEAMPKPKMFSWSLFFVIFAFMFAFNYVPHPWPQRVLCAGLVLLAVFSAIEGVIVLRRTRWVFRAIGSFGNVLLACAVIWFILRPFEYRTSTWLMFGGVAGLVLIMHFARVISRRWYPNELTAFDHARSEAKFVGIFRYRHIPVIPSLEQ